MNRKQFLSVVGIATVGGLALAFKKSPLALIHKTTLDKTDCNDPITPAVNEGPFYKNEKLTRQDIREGKLGVPISYVFKVEDVHCKPIQNAVVDIWQCDKDGHYSDFSQENTQGQTWLRGMQTTGADGVCSFKSIFPGWYNGRLTHLHGKVHYNGETKQTTNFFFPKAIEKEVYKNKLYTKGQNGTSIAEDFEIDGDTERFNALLMNVIDDGNGGYIATYTIAFK
jgi:protocatechuate 3,4-dioxygenase beta subunit